MTSRLSYGDASKEIRKSNGLDIHTYIPKRTIHSFVLQDIAPRLKRFNDVIVGKEAAPRVIMGDGTEARSIYGTNNQVRVI